MGKLMYKKNSKPPPKINIKLNNSQSRLIFDYFSDLFCSILSQT